MERAVGTQYFPCISRPYGTFGGRKAPLSTDMMSLKGQATICNAPCNLGRRISLAEHRKKRKNRSK